MQLMHEIRRARPTTAAAALCLVLGLPVAAQSPADIERIVARLDRLEQQNRELMDEVRQLREQLAAGQTPALEERVQVQENRTAELAQTKVEAAHRSPVRITGMALFNTFLNSKGSGGSEYPTAAQPGASASAGATFRQSQIGLDFDGPHTFWNGKVSGTLRLDLWGGSGQTLDQLVRLRTASIGIDWRDRSVVAGLQKPLISPRDPDSLAQVAFSPLSGAGNLWLWIPQARFEQDFHLGETAGVRAQIAMVQTHEGTGVASGDYAEEGLSAVDVEPVRPGVEARAELFAGAARRIEIAGGVHHSVSHIAYASVPSNVYSVDWLARPWRWLEFTGAAFTGENVATLGTGPLRQGWVALGLDKAYPVHSKGGWGQIALRPSERAWFNIFSGQQDDRNADLPAGTIAKNLQYGANAFYRLAPNLLASFEFSRTRTTYIGSGPVQGNHYDLALAYLF
jgi:hypothetical protein